MRAIFAALGKLFNIASRVPARAGRIALTRNTTKYAKNAVKQIKFNYKHIKFVYEELTESDKEIVDEVVAYAVQFVNQYIDHHDEYHQYRIQEHEIDDVLASHAKEILHAAESALYARARSHGYNSIFGKPDTDDAELLKDLALAVMHEVGHDLANPSS